MNKKTIEIVTHGDVNAEAYKPLEATNKFGKATVDLSLEFERQYQERLRGYSTVTYLIITVNISQDNPWIVNGKPYSGRGHIRVTAEADWMNAPGFVWEPEKHGTRYQSYHSDSIRSTGGSRGTDKGRDAVFEAIRDIAKSLPLATAINQARRNTLLSNLYTVESKLAKLAQDIAEEQKKQAELLDNLRSEGVDLDDKPAAPMKRPYWAALVFREVYSGHLDGDPIATAEMEMLSSEDLGHTAPADVFDFTVSDAWYLNQDEAIAAAKKWVDENL